MQDARSKLSLEPKQLPFNYISLVYSLDHTAGRSAVCTSDILGK